MSVIGIDFGNEACYIAVARQGGIETIANDYSLRSTPSCVAFGEKNRILGVAAKNQLTTNMKNTCFNFKRFIGKTYKDPRLKGELVGLPYHVEAQRDGSIGVVVRYLGEQKTFSPTQLTAMLFTKLKHTAEAALNIKVVDVVIGVPYHYHDAERHAMLEAASTAGLNVLRLMNETTAVALAYGIYKQDLPPAEDKPRNVIFVDCGQSTLQISAVAFNKGKLKMLTAHSDPYFGGRDFDHLLATHFAADFKSRYKIDALNNKRAFYRLLTEVEKLKKQMSANSTDLPLNIECFMEDKDVSGKMNRAFLDELASSLLTRVEVAFNKCLADSGLKVDDIYSVEIVGGSSRIPAVKALIEKVFKKSSSTTLNQDEAVARGCALQCAMLSPTFKVREFSITDVQPYNIKLLWRDDSGLEADMEVFPKNHQAPFSKMLTFYRKDEFILQAQYANPSPSPNPVIGHFSIKNVTPTPEGESQKVKVKVRINIHGLFTVASATLTEKKEIVEAEPPVAMETEEEKNKNVSNETDGVSGENKEVPNDKDKSNVEMDEQNEKKEKKTEESTSPAKTEEGGKMVKKVLKTVELQIFSVVQSLAPTQLNALVEQEAQMMQADKLENDRINAKNAVEEYVYEIRGRIHDDLKKFICDGDRNKYGCLLDSTENWLYEEGEDCHKQVYVDKLAELKIIGEPIKQRRREREDLPIAFESLMLCLQQTNKALLAFRAGDDKYSHIDSADMDKVEKKVGEDQRWVDEKMSQVCATAMHKDLHVTAAQVRSEKSAFLAVVDPIINKPKPKPKVEEPPPAEVKKETGEGEEGEEVPAKANGPSDKEQVSNQEPMDVDYEQ